MSARSLHVCAGLCTGLATGTVNVRFVVTLLADSLSLFCSVLSEGFALISTGATGPWMPVLTVNGVLQAKDTWLPANC